MQHRAWTVALLSLLVLGFLGWCLMSPSQGVPLSSARVEPVAPTVDPPPVAPLTQKRPLPIHTSTELSPSSLASSDKENRIGMPSHPVTADHRRIYRENNLIGDLNGAMDLADIAGLRGLLRQYREEYPEDAHVLQDGYALIADCLERPGPDTRAIAQRYYDEQLDSGLRRYIRRHCLEAAHP